MGKSRWLAVAVAAAVVASFGAAPYATASASQERSPDLAGVPDELLILVDGKEIPPIPAETQVEGEQGYGGLSEQLDGPGVMSSVAGVYEQHSDNVHRTAGDLSVHGWWINVSGPATRADVKTWIQVYFGGVFGWGNVAYGEKLNTRSGSGAGRRSNARVTCANAGSVFTFRGATDVDIIGYSDPPGLAYSPSNTAHRCQA